jgi:hypothetical protein
MASFILRASGLWDPNPARMTALQGDDENGSDEDLEHQPLVTEYDDPYDERTPLDRTIDRIGMGKRYHDILVWDSVVMNMQGATSGP